MNITKLPSGSYRIRQMVDGRNYSITVPYKPTKREAFALVEEKRTGIGKTRKSLAECAREYIDGKSHTLSPSTLRAYDSIARSLPEDLANEEIGQIDAWDVQVYIDRLSAEGKSPKTVRNIHGFISAVFAAFCPGTTLNTKLPQKRQESKYMPSDTDVRRILNAASGTRIEIAIRLACYGLRRSEICAITADDLDGSTLMINKALVYGSDCQWHIKPTKTAAGTRTILIDDGLADLIRQNGKAFDGWPNNIYIVLQNVQDDLGIPRFPLHYFRHWYATTMHAMGVSDADIMASGGWKTDHVMKTVYRHEKEQKEAQQKMVSFICRDK